MTTISGAANPFDHANEPEEPERGTVLAYQRLGHSGVTLDYLSFRAGDGLWYTTGEKARQGVKWGDLWAAVRSTSVGPVRYATAWAELQFERRALPGGVTSVTEPFADVKAPYWPTTGSNA